MWKLENASFRVYEVKTKRPDIVHVTGGIAFAQVTVLGREKWAPMDYQESHPHSPHGFAAPLPKLCRAK